MLKNILGFSGMFPAVFGDLTEKKSSLLQVELLMVLPCMRLALLLHCMTCILHLVCTCSITRQQGGDGQAAHSWIRIRIYCLPMFWNLPRNHHTTPLWRRWQILAAGRLFLDRSQVCMHLLLFLVSVTNWSHSRNSKFGLDGTHPQLNAVT